jgi:hypothetical protein
MTETVAFSNVGLRCPNIKKLASSIEFVVSSCCECFLKPTKLTMTRQPQLFGKPLPLGFGKLGRVDAEKGLLFHSIK